MVNKINKYLAKIFFLYFFIAISITALFYPILPKLLNYPPDSINNQFQIDIDKLVYSKQYMILILLVMVVSAIFLIIRLVKVNKHAKYLVKTKIDKEKVKQLMKIRSSCHNTPFLLYFLEIMIPLIVMPTVFFMMKANILTILKICLVYISSLTIASVISFIFSRKQFGYILNILNDEYPEIMETIEIEYAKRRRKVKSLKFTIFLQIIPLILVSVTLISLISYVQSTKKVGDIIYETYYTSLMERLDFKFNSLEEIIEKLENVELLNDKHKYFIIDKNGKYATSDYSELSEFFIKYTMELSQKENSRTYDYYCLDEEGVAIKCYLQNGNYYYAGIKYETKQIELLKIVLLSDLLINILIIFVLIYIARSLAGEIDNVSRKLKNIASSNKDNINLNNNLVITSEDELADLILYFNLTQKLTKHNIDRIHDSQETLMEQERLASLGQLIGGISHNLKTPIMSISGAAEGLNDLIREYNESIGDPEVTNEDHHDIAKDMTEWVEKIKSYAEYMSDIISTVKGQAVELSKTEEDNFTIDELIKKVNILMKHELKKAFITLNTTINVDENLTINGDVSGLVQIVNNLIANAIQAYNGRKYKEINLIVNQNNNNIEILVQDFASGISNKIKDKLFKEMITTKGKNGSGLGLFMSYSTIKGHFKGDLKFESEEGKGTTFYIIIPINK